jgi:GNAT superfamily N-acetyltransferase
MKTVYTRNPEFVRISLHADSKAETSEESSTEPLQNPTSGKDILEVNKDPTFLGFVRCNVMGPHTLYLEQTYINPKSRDQGLGKLLYLKLFKWCRDHGFSSITGYVVEVSAIPILVRYKMAGARTYLYTDSSKQIDKWEKLGLQPIKHGDVWYITHDIEPSLLKKLIPCHVVTYIQ